MFWCGSWRCVGEACMRIAGDDARRRSVGGISIATRHTSPNGVAEEPRCCLANTDLFYSTSRCTEGNGFAEKLKQLVVAQSSCDRPHNDILDAENSSSPAPLLGEVGAE